MNRQPLGHAGGFAVRCVRRRVVSRRSRGRSRRPRSSVYDLPVTRTVTTTKNSPARPSHLTRCRGPRVGCRIHDQGLLQGRRRWSRRTTSSLRDRSPAVQGRSRSGRGERQADRGPLWRGSKGSISRAKNLLVARSISQEEHDRYEADYEETEANLKLAKANRDLASSIWTGARSRPRISGLLQPPHGRPRQPGQGRRHRADLDRQPGSALCLLRRARAGHAQDQRLMQQGQAPGPRPRGKCRSDRPVR